MRRWRGELLGALNGAATMLPFVLSYAFIVYGALGPAAAQVGLTASVTAVVAGGLLLVPFTRTLLPAAAPSASAALMLGAAVTTLTRDPALQLATPGGGAQLLAVTAAIAMAGGLLQMLLGLLRAGTLVRFVPQPVLAGFMNGVAILIVVSQLPLVLGLPAGSWERLGAAALRHWQGAALLAALGTALLAALLRWRWPAAPAPLLGLVLAAAAVLGAQALAPALMPGLQQIGPLQAMLPTLTVLAPWADAEAVAILGRHGGTMALTALLLALIGALESVLNIAAVDQQTGGRCEPNRELVALGLANVLCGAVGGLPLVYQRLRALATWTGGGRSWHAVALGSGLLLVVFVFGLPLLEILPTAVVAGIVVMLAWTLVDPWTRRLLRQWWDGDRSDELRWSLAVVAGVCAVTLVWGFVAGVGVGVLLAMLIFVRALHRSLVRSRYSAAALPSRRVRVAAQEALLAPARPGIVVLELEGALFFGNSDRLLQEAESGLEGLTDLILDLRRVSTLDASGALAIARLQPRLQAAGVRLRLAGAMPAGRHGRALASQGVTGLEVHPDADRALEAAEEAALQAAAPGLAARAVPPSASQLAEGLDARQQALLLGLLQPRHLAAGERLFVQGDPGQALYLLSAGSISVADRTRDQRFASFSPGMCFGETAVLDAGGRTADAVADIDSVVHELPAAAFERLLRDEPALAALLYRNLARHLSARLRAAAEGWRRAAG